MPDAEPLFHSVLSSTVLHVDDVQRSVVFYEQALGLRRAFVDEHHLYAEMETGSTKLALTQRAFAAEQACDTAAGGLDVPPPATELAFTVDDVQRALDATLAAGAVLVRSPATKYWGQTVAYVRDPDGYLVQICTAVLG
jgi:lactoylglutathione lyase